MRIGRWQTIVSDCKDLYFVKLSDEGYCDFRSTFCFTVEDKLGHMYDVIVEKPGPYVVVDEENLTKYWNLSDETTGWTFVVEDSPLTALFPGVFEAEKIHHYVVATWDICLEVLTESVPVIRQR